MQSYGLADEFMTNVQHKLLNIYNQLNFSSIIFKSTVRLINSAAYSNFNLSYNFKMIRLVLTVVLFVNWISAEKLQCTSEYLGTCQVRNQTISATDSFDLLKINGSPVTDLFLIYSEMPKMPNTIFTNYPNVSFLSISYNGIKELSLNNFANALKLKKAFLRNGDLTRLTNATFRSCIQLESLVISNHKITVIESNAFQGLRNLISLSLDQNSISKLSTSVFETTPNLEYLSVNENQITTLSSTLFSKNQNLDFISFCDNQLTNLPSDIFSSVPLLSSLYLTNNHLTNISTFGAKYVDIRSNFLKTVKIVEGIQTLHLTNNFIERLQCDNAISSITRMYAGNNSLTNFNCIKNMENLTDLNLLGNKFSRLNQSVFVKLNKLKDISFYNETQFTKLLAKSFAPLKTLLYLRVDKLVTYTNLRQLFPSLFMLSLSPRTWNCNYTQKVANTLTVQKIRMNYNNYWDRYKCNVVQPQF